MERRVYGIETEYGLSLETREHRLPQLDPGTLFSHLERALLAHYPTLESDSFGRNPLAERDQIRFQEGHFLESGARLYYDTGHAEWATPEATSARQAVLYEMAGDRTLADLAAAAGLPRGSELLLVKNNIDYVSGATYGSHENYQVERKPASVDDDRFWTAMIADLVPFLVTRQIFCGSGKLGCADPRAALGYQISQRADYIERIASSSSREARALVNTRDECLADATRSRRLHLILGDSNRSPHAALLKLGTTGLVLRLIEEGKLGKVPELADPLGAFRTVSRDLSCRAALPLRQGGSLTAIEIQRLYLARAETHLAASDPAAGQVLAYWQKALDDLAVDPMLIADRVDWAIKLARLFQPRVCRAQTGWPQAGAWSHLFARLQRGDGRVPEAHEITLRQTAREQPLIDRHGLRWCEYEPQRRLHFELRELDLRYHEIRHDQSLFSLLEDAGLIRHEVDPAEISTAQRQPPAETRAQVRAEAIRWAHRCGRADAVLLDWGQVGLPPPAGIVRLDDPLAPTSAALTRALARIDDGEVPVRVLAVEPVVLPGQPTVAAARPESSSRR